MTGVGRADAPELDLEFPPKPEYIRTVRLAVAALARLHDVPDELVEDIRLAVSEACTSALPDAGPAEAEAQALRVLASSGDGRFTVEIIDRGSAIERAVAGRPDEIETEDLPFERTLAVPVIRGLVDELAVTPQEGGGASIRMVVSLEGSRPE
jgi:anti-sigma regulatory factor (Ser/Thr protein kinase)